VYKRIIHVANALGVGRAVLFAPFGDKETTVEIRGNSHYRNSRNAYRSVNAKTLLGKGRAVCAKRVQAGYSYKIVQKPLFLEKRFCILSFRAENNIKRKGEKP